MQRSTKLFFLTSKGSLLSFDNIQQNRCEQIFLRFPFASPYLSDSENLLFHVLVDHLCLLWKNVYSDSRIILK